MSNRQAARAIVIKEDQFLVMDRNKYGHQYYSLIGGTIDPGEQPLDTVLRELEEEASMTVANPRLVVIEDAGSVFGLQHIFLCEYVSGEPELNPYSIEYKISLGQENMFNPRWINLKDLPEANLLPRELKSLILKFLAKGFPNQPINLKIENTNEL